MPCCAVRTGPTINPTQVEAPLEFGVTGRVYEEGSQMDKILICGLRVYAFHGVREEEQRKGQPFVLDLTLEADLTSACRSDRLEETVNYSQVTRTVLLAMDQPAKLIEHAAQHVADSVLETFSKVSAVTVLLKKPRAPIAADFDYVAVEIRRERGAEGVVGQGSAAL